MKKFLQIFSTLLITSSAVMLLGSNVNDVQTEIKKETILDWDTVENDTFKYFSNMKNQKIQNSKLKIETQQKNKQIDMVKFFAFAEEKAKNYILRFQKEDMNLDEIMNVLKSENPGFRKYANSELENKNKLVQSYLSSNYLVDNTRLNSEYQNKKNELNQFILKIKTYKASFITASAVCGIAAAGFWAAAWFFGITVPAAIAATIASTTLGAIAAGFSVYLLKYREKEGAINDVVNVAIALTAIVKIRFLAINILKPLLISSTIPLTATTWVLPAVGTALSAVFAIISWIEILNY